MAVNRDLAFWCREQIRETFIYDLVDEMSKDAINRMTGADPKDMDEIRAGRSQYDAAQDLLSLVQKYANLDLDKL